MQKIPKREYTPEFGELAIKGVQAGQAVDAVAKELGVNHQSIRNWIKAAGASKLVGAGSKDITPKQKGPQKWLRLSEQLSPI